jgi:hypothetical protein
MAKKQQQNKTTKHTIEFSNNTLRPRSRPAALGRLLAVRTARAPPKWSCALRDIVALDGLAASQRLDQVTREKTPSQTPC